MTRSFASATSNAESRARKSSFEVAFDLDERIGRLVVHAAILAGEDMELATQLPHDLGALFRGNIEIGGVVIGVRVAADDRPVGRMARGTSVADASALT